MTDKRSAFSVSNELDEIELPFDQLQELEKNYGRQFPFPSVTIFKKGLYFSKRAVPFLPQYVKWRVNDEWCVLVPSSEHDKNSYKLRPIDQGVAGCFPAEISPSYQLMKGTHKLYKSGKNICFKRYETVEPGNENCE